MLGARSTVTTVQVKRNPEQVFVCGWCGGAIALRSRGRLPKWRSDNWSVGAALGCRREDEGGRSGVEGARVEFVQQLADEAIGDLPIALDDADDDLSQRVF